VYGFFQLAAMVSVAQISAGETDHFAESAELLGKLAAFAADQEHFSNSQITEFARPIHTAWAWAGKSGRFDEWAETLPEKHRQSVRKVAEEIPLFSLQKSINDWALWRVAPAGEMPARYARAMLTRPELKAHYPHDASWTLRIDNPKLGEALREIAADPPENLLPRVRPALAAFAGREAAGNDRHAEAVAHFDRAIAGAEGGKWKAFRGQTKVRKARSLAKLGENAKAVELLENGLSEDELTKHVAKARDKALKQLKE
jgi:hypothetical protein